MLGVGHRYSQQHHYKIHRTKTKIVVNNSGKKQSNYIWSLGDIQIHSSEETTHLGLKRTESGECEVNVNDRIKSARRTKYSLMNSGYHGTNSLSPVMSFQTYKTYVLPQLLYGLEILPLNKKHIASLEKQLENHLITPGKDSHCSSVPASWSVTC